MGDFIAKAIAFVRRRVSRGRQPPALVRRPLDVEVTPIRFEVSLLQPIPEVAIWVRVVNYSRREMQISEIAATSFQPDEAPSLETLPGGEFRIPARQSWDAMCHRLLMDSETRALEGAQWTHHFRTRLAMRVRGTDGKKSIALDPTGFDIHGWIVGLPSQPSLKPPPT